MMDEPLEQYRSYEKLELNLPETEETEKFKKIHCPSCKDEVVAGDISLETGIGKCCNCNAVFSIEEDLKELKTSKDAKHQILRPEGIDMFQFGDDLEITLSQHLQGLDLWGAWLTPLIAAGVLLAYFKGTASVPLYVVLGTTFITLYFLLKAITYSKSKTYIDVNKRSLTVKYRPKNFKADKVFDAGDIDQLYLKASGEMPGHFVIHMVVNGEDGQKHEKLMAVNSISKAKYLEQEIEKYLNIKDRKVIEATG